MDEKQREDMWNVMRKHNFELADGTSSEFECTICKKIVVNACTAPCRCLFCLDCIKQYLHNGTRKCPGQSKYCDVDEIDFNSDIQVNRVIDKRISKLSVKCPNVGCQSQVELSMIGGHLGTCESPFESCPCLIIGCEDVKLRNDQMSEHLSTEIRPHTKLLMNWIRNSQNETRSMKIEIDKLRSEVNKLSRANNELNAQVISNKKNFDRANQKKEKENSTKMEKLNDKLASVKSANRSMNEELKAVKDEMGKQITQLNALVLKQINEIEDLKRRCNLTGDKEDQHRPDMSHVETMDTRNSMDNIQEIINEKISGEFHWVIKNWTEKLEKAQKSEDKKIFSCSFLTHDRGYQICLSLKPNFDIGDLWLDFRIERGPFDDLLRWPFDHDLEISLMNSQSGLACKTLTQQCSLFNIDYPSLQKPTSERNYSILIFSVTMKELSSSPQLTKNDKLWIKLSVKPASIEVKTK